MWSVGKPITTGQEYIESLRNRELSVYLFGEQIDDPVEHPIIRPSINALAATYDLAQTNPDLAASVSPYTGEKINRFLHIAENADDLILQNKMQRKLGQLTGTCFQRCVGMDAINSLHSVTYDMDQKYQSDYHQKFLSFLTMVQHGGFVISGAMTDVKGNRNLLPHQQSDPDLYVRVVDRNEDGVFIRGAKAHQTGCINSHWLIVMPTLRLTEKDKTYAIVGAIPVDAKGITYIYGRQSSETRHMEESTIDTGNQKFSGQEALVIFENVFIPNEFVFLDGEYEFAAPLVERFTCYHRRSYVCKSGVGDVLIGAAATIAEYNGVDKASHVKDKLTEMTHLNETIYGVGISSSQESEAMPSGVYMPNDMLANVCKHHVTKLTYEIGRLAQDLAGGLVATMPSEKDLKHPELGKIIQKYLKTKPDLDPEDRVRILRLIENMTLGRNAVGYLTESLHGAGSPQAQRVRIAQQMQLDFKKELARVLAGIIPEPKV
ncbi:MAG: 4-hydroxyphenylacetate 3-hydroxylase N-terminal domain-containing protein [Candidatus Neomarinimicrobiota bacterium]|jgi:4-hydroxybutyryl-CoA dehydratase/vinylacetyl-CoA-Delta-isomerase|nr:4-hydroxybutyryl-CoA dehydratase [Candidatus Neomarinimicrobiota bacterium]MEE1506552.1 4-hydroxyphenylacetate 3-hydroxylase N-terminal domain-containing protein [Candidatus Neomarinimicrobiota bacterium]MEE1573176.1 4-hydroxyphenylacetate 3-hydroxylase N-terminal domain-containing protein [Candidatus Neomarinimicrobiota bacterium]HJL80993.1 4-hydroxyphenylacetate 3-hydroxylase N-terminal domain-containing protein [Gammaproteobacteria bacterium]|tara:strand:- start:2433 stop:3902 length:1470 start_codon:yes stop_codon:yes gene_type:complete